MEIPLLFEAPPGDARTMTGQAASKEKPARDRKIFHERGDSHNIIPAANKAIFLFRERSKDLLVLRIKFP